jgi:hypothetical protein
MACSACNPLAIPIFGAAGVLSFLAPYRGVIALLSIALLINAIKLSSGMEDFNRRRRAVADVPVFRFLHRERIMPCPLYAART